MAQTTEGERIERLRSIPLFAECSDESLRRILTLATEFEVEPLYVLIEADQPASGMFIVEEGKVVVEIHGDRIELGAGESFGELGVLDEHAVRSARVSSLTHARCLAIGRDDFEDLLHSEPTIAISLLRVLARRLASLIHR